MTILTILAFIVLAGSGCFAAWQICDLAFGRRPW